MVGEPGTKFTLGGGGGGGWLYNTGFTLAVDFIISLKKKKNPALVQTKTPLAQL